MIQRAVQTPQHNSALLTILFGQSEIEKWNKPTTYSSKRLKQLANDMMVVHNSNDPGDRPICPWHNLADSIDRSSLEWLANLPKAQLSKVLTTFSSVERSSLIKDTASNEPIHCCTACDAKFDTNAKLQTHRYQSHNYRHPLRSLATSNICPLCSPTYKNLRTCQSHIANVSVERHRENLVERSRTLPSPNLPGPQNIRVLLSREDKRPT